MVDVLRARSRLHALAIVMLLALLFDGARGLVTRRELQNTSDAAALAAANIIQAQSPRGCSATAGPPPGAPQAGIVAAAKASVAINLPDYPQDEVVVSCPTGWDNYGVQVTLTDTSPTFFGSIFGGGPLDVVARSSAVNGQTYETGHGLVVADRPLTTFRQSGDGFGASGSLLTWLWFRYVTGTIEVVSGALLLVPSLAIFGALALVPTMVGAILTHVFLIGGSPAPAMVLLVATSAIAWARWPPR